jgi:hypothetical protein
VLTEASGELRLDDGNAAHPLWQGIDQERFSETSWRGDGVVPELVRMRSRSGQPHQGRL